MTDRDSVAAGATLHVGLRLQLKPGWHTYWLNAGDAGEPPTLKVTASGAMTGQSETIDFPTPVRISEGGLMSYAYTGDVLLPQALKLEGQEGPITLKAHAEWLVCAATCVPEQGDFTLSLPAGKSAANSSAEGPLFVHASQASPVPSPFAASVASDGVLSLSGKGLSPASIERAWFMPSETGVIDQVAPQKLAVSEGSLTLKLNWIDAAHQRLAGRDCGVAGSSRSADRALDQDGAGFSHAGRGGAACACSGSLVASADFCVSWRAHSQPDALRLPRSGHEGIFACASGWQPSP
ncbi:protein-disulfide reductase DsbD domain-containing protein [Asaia platycodi]|uniref:protein-disulfide reductase DsbD domain-containing protein n=1 Tax=Asaia platycodi TaxID=610243 RepID=UPI000AAF2CEA|nr:protein-disulfide reductase DsbD domain-containing protein [Asaia platycodi]